MNAVPICSVFADCLCIHTQSAGPTRTSTSLLLTYSFWSDSCKRNAHNSSGRNTVSSSHLSLYLRMCHLKIACTALCAFVSHLDDLGGSNVYNVGYSHYHLHIPILVKLAFNFHPIFECAENTVSNEIFNKFFYRIRKVVAINRHFSTSFFLFTLSAQCRFSVVTNAWHFMNLNVQMFVSRLKNTTNRIDSNLFKSITQERNKHSNMEIIINRSHLASSKDRWFNVYNVAPCVSHGMARLIYSNWSVSFCTYVCTK